MIKKKTLFILIVASIVLLSLFAIFKFANTSLKSQNAKSVAYEAEKHPTDNFGNEILEKLTDISYINEESLQFLNVLGKSTTEEITNNEMIYDTFMNRQVSRVTFNSFEIDIDDKGNVVNYKNFDDYSTEGKDKRDYTDNDPLPEVEYILNNEEDLTDIIALIENNMNLNNYELITCNGEIKGSWSISWCKKYGEIVNPYECLNVTIDGKDGSIRSFGRNDLKPDSFEAVVTKEEAIKYASDEIKKCESEIDSIELTIINPYYLNISKENEFERNDVRLSWVITLKNYSIIYVDAINGEVLGGGRHMGLCLVKNNQILKRKPYIVSSKSSLNEHFS